MPLRDFNVYIHTYQRRMCRVDVPGASVSPLALACSSNMGSADNTGDRRLWHRRRQSRPLYTGLWRWLCRHCSRLLHDPILWVADPQGALSLPSQGT